MFQGFQGCCQGISLVKVLEGVGFGERVFLFHGDIGEGDKQSAVKGSGEFFHCLGSGVDIGSNDAG